MASTSTRAVMTSETEIWSNSMAACTSSDWSSSSTCSSSAVSMMLCSSSTASSSSASASLLRGSVMRVMSFTTSQTRGKSRIVRMRTGTATPSAWRVAFSLATIFGMVSPKMMIVRVMAAVAIQTFLSLPVSAITRTEPRDEAAMFTRLLPMRIAERALSKDSVIFSAMPARLEPSSRRRSRRSVLQEESAISDPEKNAERITQSTRPAIRKGMLMRPRLPSLREAAQSAASGCGCAPSRPR